MSFNYHNKPKKTLLLYAFLTFQRGLKKNQKQHRSRMGLASDYPEYWVVISIKKHKPKINYGYKIKYE